MGSPSDTTPAWPELYLQVWRNRLLAPNPSQSIVLGDAQAVSEQAVWIDEPKE
jgi:hypothetical protein